MRIKTAALIIGIVLWMAAPAWAGTVTFSFANCNVTSPSPLSGSCPGDLGTSQATFGSDSPSGYTVTASGYFTSSTSSPSDNLYVKTSGGDENGLGLVSEDSDHEINTNQFIQLNLSSLANAGFTGGTLTIGSVQSGEGYSIFTSNTAGVLGSLELSGTTDNSPISVSWSASDPILGITAYVPAQGSSGSDVLLTSLSASTPNNPTPEPASLALMGSGLIALAIVSRRYSKVSLAKNQ
jgi:hypothetical protein